MMDRVSKWAKHSSRDFNCRERENEINRDVAPVVLLVSAHTIGIEICESIIDLARTFDSLPIN